MKRSKLLIVFLLFAGSVFSKKLKEGTYRAVLIIDAEKKLEVPFNFDVKYNGKRPVLVIKNADERITVEEISIKKDSVNFKMPVFDTEFRTKLVGDTLIGVWINHYKTTNNVMKFKAVFGESKRFLFTPGSPNPYFEGRWVTTFSPESKDSSMAIGVFHHLEQTDYLTGTFLSETGDLRYLEGMKHSHEIYLSCFDGVHAYLFIAGANGRGALVGKFYSGPAYVEEWVARRNETFQLRDAEEITFLKNKDAVIRFTFPDTDKKQVSLDDKKFAGKPVIIQVMGSWCPNCMDEGRYLASVYKQYKPEGLEIIGLAFEKTSDFEKARSQALRMKNNLGMDYEVLITGQTGREKASEVLSALNTIVAFPTTLFLNKQHQVVKVHTGFSGPATGNEYEVYKQRTENLIKQLLKE